MMVDERPATYSVPAAAALLGMSKATLYRAINRGDIIAIRFGRAVQIPAHVVERLLADGNTQQAAS
jgi:excisionase family DNA binding protein